MYKNYKKQNKSFGHNSFQKIYLLSDFLEEPKEKKNWFTGQLEKYMTTIKKDVDKIIKEERYDRLRRKIHLNSFSQTRKHMFPDINKFNHMIHLTKGNKFYLQKFSNKNLINISDDISKNNSSIINSEKIYEYKNNNIKRNHSEGNIIFDNLIPSQKTFI